MATPIHLQRRWSIRAFLPDGSTAYYPAMGIKREARREARRIVTDERYVACLVVDGHEEFEPRWPSPDFILKPNALTNVFNAVDAIGSFILRFANPTEGNSMSDTPYTYQSYPIPSDPRIVLDALDRRLAEGIGGHARRARMMDHRASLVAQIAAEDDAAVNEAAMLAQHHADNLSDALANPAKTEDGAVDHPASAEDIAEAEATKTIEASREMIHNYTNPDLHPVTNVETAAVVAWCREWAADTFGSDYRDDTTNYTDAYVLRQCERHIEGGLAFVLADVRRVWLTDGLDTRYAEKPRDMTTVRTRDAVAASLALKAAETFTYDDDAEDAEGAAQRAADILKDLSPSDVPAFALKVFGMPLADRFASAEYDELVKAQQLTYANPDDDLVNARARMARMRELRNQVATEKGMPEIASRLVIDHADTIVSTVFKDHEGMPNVSSDTTNLTQWKEGQSCLAALNTLRAFTYGAGPLDSRTADRAIETMDMNAVSHCIEAVQYAADNARQGDAE